MHLIFVNTLLILNKISLTLILIFGLNMYNVPVSSRVFGFRPRIYFFLKQSL